jgi:CRISPR-associated protein Csx16
MSVKNLNFLRFLMPAEAMTTWFVSRHPGAVVWAEQQGLCVDRHASHLSVTHIRQITQGDTVIGTLPIHLAASVCQVGARFINLSLDIPANWRGRELNAEELQVCNARLEAFIITQEVI